MTDVAERIALSRPRPPLEVSEHRSVILVPAPDLLEWARAAFIVDGAPLYNPEHAHLEGAEIGMLWTSIDLNRHGRAIAGTCEMPTGQGNKWTRGRSDFILGQWFGVVPDFLITIHAPYAAEMTDAQFCALIEHELLHAGQAKDDLGLPKMTKDGDPVFAMRGHDYEQFGSVVRRYGAEASGVQGLIEAAAHPPEIATEALRWACGACG